MKKHSEKFKENSSFLLNFKNGDNTWLQPKNRIKMKLEKKNKNMIDKVQQKSNIHWDIKNLY